jgi:hypothetical protein
VTQEPNVDESTDAAVIDAVLDESDDLTADVDDSEDVLLLEEVETQSELPMWEPTGDHRVDAALDLLGGIDPDDVHQHAAVFTEVHQQLRDVLADLDARP